MCAATATVDYNFRQINALRKWVNHTYDVVEKMETMVSAVKDVQSAQRGFAITGEEDYLIPFYNALPVIEEKLADIERLVADNTTQEKRFARLRKITNERLAFAGRVIAARRENGQQAAFAMIQTGTGNLEMAQIRSISTDMINEESRLLKERQLAVDRAEDITMTVGAISVLICFAILVLVFWQIHRESRRRTLIEESLSETLDRVNRISAEVQLINKMGDYLQGCRNPEEAFQMIARNMPLLLPGTHGAIALFNNSHNNLEMTSGWGDTSAMANDFQPESCWAMRRGRPHEVPFGGSEPMCDHFTRPVEGDVLCLPMQAHGETFGMFFIGSDTADVSLDERQTVIRTVSEQISLAIANLKLQKSLREQSIRDPLTHLFNRRYLEATMEREFARAKRNTQPVSLLIMDIDHFKRINDTYGHDAGDAVLQAFARMLLTKVRKEDIACRFGGEEFVLVLPAANPEMAMKRGEEVCAAMRALEVSTGGQTLANMSVSVGVATYPVHGDKPETLLLRADKALYEAKHGGRNQVVMAADKEA